MATVYPSEQKSNYEPAIFELFDSMPTIRGSQAHRRIQSNPNPFKGKITEGVVKVVNGRLHQYFPKSEARPILPHFISSDLTAKSPRNTCEPSIIGRSGIQRYLLSHKKPPKPLALPPFEPQPSTYRVIARYIGKVEHVEQSIAYLSLEDESSREEFDASIAVERLSRAGIGIGDEFRVDVKSDEKSDEMSDKMYSFCEFTKLSPKAFTEEDIAETIRRARESNLD